MAKGLIEENTLKGIADAIRAKTGSIDTLLPPEMASAIASIPTVPVGSIMLWGGIDIPQNWALCNGDKYKIEDNPELYAAIGDTYGSGPTGFFKIPDFTYRFPLGWGYSDTLGEKGGEETHILTINEMPKHDHSISNNHNSQYKIVVNAASGGGQNYGMVYQGGKTNNGPYVVADYVGGGQPHNNMPPYLRIKFIIKVK